MATYMKNKFSGHWNTAKIAAELHSIRGVSGIRNIGQGGDVDTENLVITIKGTSDELFVCGFSVDNDIIAPGDTDVEMIELSDGLDSRGGLTSSHPKTAEAYIRVRQYFLDRGFKVVPTHKAYF